MYVFVDESGDPGMNLEAGSSPFFVVTAVTFQEEEHMDDCGSKIDAVRQQLGLPAHVEFKFAKSSDSVREVFFAEDFRVQLFLQSHRHQQASAMRTTFWKR